MFGKLAVAGLTLGALALGTPARAADATVKVGVINCHVSSGWGLVFGSTRDLRCVFTGGGRTENYTGKISKFGVDIGFQQSGVILWAVLAPSTDLRAGALTGDYGGVTAGATAAGVGGDANVLIGGSAKSISLQPVSIEGDKGTNLAVGIASITLRYSR